MLTIFGKGHRRGGFCDGVSRRDFRTIGGTLLGGALALPNLLAAESQSGIKLSHKAVINVYLPGGPPHIDLFDLKLDRTVVHVLGSHKDGIAYVELQPFFENEHVVCVPASAPYDLRGRLHPQRFEEL